MITKKDLLIRIFEGSLQISFEEAVDTVSLFADGEIKILWLEKCLHIINWDVMLSWDPSLNGMYWDGTKWV